MLTRLSRLALKAEADARHRIHKHQVSSRPLSNDYELVGLAGEAQFELDFHIPRDRRLLPMGDGRVDFRVGSFTIDPKVARLAFNLLREVDKPHSDILLLGAYHELGDDIWVNWLGWETDEEMLKCPTRVFKDGGPVNHYKPAAKLRPMSEFCELLNYIREGY
jgi:hypothetical protein